MEERTSFFLFLFLYRETGVGREREKRETVENECQKKEE